jgi:glycosyltransferase involved in cell wall biosynthesis
MVRRLTIALVTETYLPEVNGVAMTLGRLVAGLSARGHRIMIVRPRQKHETSGRLADGQILTPGIPLPGYAELRYGLPAGKVLHRAWKESLPDIVHIATEGPLGWSALAATRHLEIPVVSSFHTNFHSYSHHYRLGWLKDGIEAYLRWFHNRTLATLVPTAALADTLARRGFRNVEVLARGVDTGLFHPSRRSPSLRAQWGASEHDPVIMIVGRVAAEKNLDLALRTFAAIRALQPAARMICVGEGPLRQSLAKRHPECRFVGNQYGEELARHYASADLFLFPSLTDTYGNVVAEALASGLAVVGFDYAASACLVEHGVNGLRVPVGDEEAFIAAGCHLAQATVRVSGNPAASVVHLDWSKVAGRHESLLLQAIDQHERRCRLHFIPE